MAIGAVLIFPGIAPVGASAQDNQRSVSDGGFVGGGIDQNAAIISGAEFAQAELGGSEMIDTGCQVREVATNQIKLDFIERPGTGGGAKVNLTAGILPVPGNPSGKVKELGDC